MNCPTSKKKKILIHGNFCKAFTGFGKHKKNLLKYLYGTGKYEIVELANAKTENDPSCNSTPWRTIGTLPEDTFLLRSIQHDQKRHRDAGYGHELIDKIIEKEKPDIYLGIEDVWAFDGFPEKEWWNILTPVIHTTVDSLPLFPPAIDFANKLKHYYVWASFAEKEFARLGNNNVKTIRGVVDTKDFFKLLAHERESLRNTSNLKDSFVIGFVFRNQLRKSVPNLLDGFKKICDRFPNSKAKLYLHTNWAEQSGWDIPRLIDEKGIDIKSVVTTYLCSNCHNFFVHHYVGEKQHCPLCNKKDGLSTVNIQNGVNEKQLNQIYNLFDVYCHPFTSGGQEIPIQEAKLTELITLVTDYSCGEDNCTKESGGFPLTWSEYREHGTQFIKASTNSDSIFSQIKRVMQMSLKDREIFGKKSRQFVLDNFSIEKVGAQFEKIFDEAPFANWGNAITGPFSKRDPFYTPNSDKNNLEWLKDLYKNCLKMIVGDSDSGLSYWLSQFEKGESRKGVLDFFHKTAIKENLSNSEKSLKDIIDISHKKRIAYVMPQHEEDVLISTSVVKSLKRQYPEHDIYFFTDKRHFELLDECEEIYKVCEFYEEMDFDCFYFIGKSGKEPYFDLAFFPYKETKRSLDYVNHGRTKIEFDLK